MRMGCSGGEYLSAFHTGLRIISSWYVSSAHNGGRSRGTSHCTERARWATRLERRFVGAAGSAATGRSDSEFTSLPNREIENGLHRSGQAFTLMRYHFQRAVGGRRQGLEAVAVPIQCRR